jgi:hypothetical protein
MLLEQELVHKHTWMYLEVSGDGVAKTVHFNVMELPRPTEYPCPTVTDGTPKINY